MLAPLVERFGDRDVRVGTSPDPVAVFPAIHLEVGDVSVRIGGADHAIGSVGQSSLPIACCSGDRTIF